MERGNNKRVRKSVSLLGLEDWVPIRDVRKLIWNHLNPIDKLMVWGAHGVHTWFEQDRYWFVKCLVKYGYLELLLWYTCGKKDIVTKIIYYGHAQHLHMIKWIAENDFEHFNSVGISQVAASKGNLNILKYIRSLGLPLTDDVSIRGAANGYIEIVKWAKEMGYEIYSRATLNIAIERENTELLKWCLDNTDASEFQPCWLACRKDKLNMLKIMINHGCYFDRELCLNAVVKDSEIETWILKNT